MAHSRQQAAGYPDATSQFLQGLRDLGYVEGRNTTIEWRSSDNVYERLPMLAEELVKLKVDVIVMVGTPGVRAAQRATTTIRIVAASFADPVASGFAASLARPGGNVTGLSNMGEDTDSKRLELISSVMAKSTRIAYLLNPDNAAVAKIAHDLKAVAGKVGKELLIVNARTADEITKAIAGMVKQRAGGVVIGDDGFLNPRAKQIAELAKRHNLPSMFPVQVGVEAGGLMYFGVVYADMYRRAATYVDKILKGANPGGLPIEQPTKFEFMINAKTAKTLGIKIPDVIMLRADKVIE